MAAVARMADSIAAVARMAAWLACDGEISNLKNLWPVLSI